jgi:archaellum component FlaF (FlaF/FlaG flagellin family)
MISLTQVQTGVVDVSQAPVVSDGKVIFKTSPLLYTWPLASLTLAVMIVLIPTVVIVESMK